VKPTDKQGEPTDTAALPVCAAVAFVVGSSLSGVGREPSRRTAKQVRLIPDATLNTAALAAALAAKVGAAVDADAGPLSKGMSLGERRTLTVTKVAPRPATINKTARGPGPTGFDAGRGKALPAETAKASPAAASVKGDQCDVSPPVAAATATAAAPATTKGGRGRAPDTFEDAD
jgi:hypothetical protein